MKRRDLVAALAAAAISPRLAEAQPREGMRRIGVLTTFSESDAAVQARQAAFRKRLEELGWRDGQAIRVEYRWAAGDPARLRLFARELVGAHPDVIFAVTTPAVAALLKETRTIPIVFAQVSDPIGSGFVASLSRPGGNVTGFTDINIQPSVGGKWLELVKEIAPAVRRAAMIYNPAMAPFAPYFLHPFEAAGRVLSVQTSAAAVHSDADVEGAMVALTRQPGGAFAVMPDAFTIAHRNPIVSLAARYRLPGIYPDRLFAEIGGLLSYGVDTEDLFRRAAEYVDRILKGAKPAELPVQAPTKFALVINLKTAADLDLTVPAMLLVGAAEVIE
jgi:putative ABC transport system substrate-binding protein